jgi:multiple sugar transport system substrate-binding protein
LNLKKTLTVLVSSALLLTAAGCGGSSKDNASSSAAPAASGAATATKAPENKDPVKIRIAWWGGQSRHDYTLKVIEMYKQLHPNVTIEAEYAPYDDYWKKLAPQAAANQLPDIIQMDFSYLTQYGGRDQLEDLTSYTKSGSLNVADVSENALSAGKLNGKLVAMNLGVNALTTMVDTNAFKKVGVDVPTMEKGWTWDDLDKAAEKAKAGGKIMAGAGGHHEVFFAYYRRELGQKMYAEDGTQLGYSDDKPFIDYFTRYQKWYDSGALLTLDKEATKKGTPEEDEMAMGNSISGWGWSNQFLGVVGAAKREGIELAPMPGPNANKGLFLKPSMFFSVTKNSKVKEEAAKFISYWINDVEANKLIKGERGVPVSSKVVAALKPVLTPNEAKVFDYVAWADKNSSPIDPPPPVGSAEVEKLLKDTSEQIMYKKTSIQDAAAKFRKDANAILAKNKK